MGADWLGFFYGDREFFKELRIAGVPGACAAAFCAV